jgi:hypothetical protein
MIKLRAVFPVVINNNPLKIWIKWILKNEYFKKNIALCQEKSLILESNASALASYTQRGNKFSGKNFAQRNFCLKT